MGPVLDSLVDSTATDTWKFRQGLRQCIAQNESISAIIDSLAACSEIVSGKGGKSVSYERGRFGSPEDITRGTGDRM